MSYEGAERRNDHCDMHTVNTSQLGLNTEKLAELAGGISTAKWIFGGILAASFTLATMIITSYAGQISDSLREIKTDLKDVKITVVEIQVDNAVNSRRLDVLERGQ